MLAGLRAPRFWKPIAACAAVAVFAAVALAGAHPEPEPQPEPLTVLAPVHAVGMRVDTLFVGGYARGSFRDALQALASDLSVAERTLVGQHLDKIFVGVLSTQGLGSAGRLRVAYERAVRPDGTPRSIRILVAEAAVGGQLHTAYFFDHGDKPGYFDPFGRSLEPHAWAGPLGTLRVTSPFGTRRMHPILRRVLPHTGVDYAAGPGSPVRATGDGIVSRAGWNGGYGNLVEIQHPSGYSTRYAHLSRIAPGVGHTGWVRQGEVIGYVGQTGLATGPHLHYEVRRYGRPVDPQRVAAEAGIASELAGAAGWPAERRRLARLLAGIPTVTQSREREG